MRAPSPRQYDLLRAVAQHVAAGWETTQASLAKELGLKSQSSITEPLRMLVKKGCLVVESHGPGKPRSIRLTPRGREVVA